jgi:hypothetical protein
MNPVKPSTLSVTRKTHIAVVHALWMEGHSLSLHFLHLCLAASDLGHGRQPVL